MRILNLILMVVMLSACGGSSVDTIDSKTVERDSNTPNSKPKSLFYWTHDTIIQVNEPLVKLMDTLYQYVCSDSFKIKNIEQNLKWMGDYRKQLCRYYDKNSLSQDVISQYVKADSVIAEARRLWKVDEDYSIKKMIDEYYSTLGMMVSFRTERTRLVFEQYNELARLLDLCKTPIQRQILCQEFCEWVDLMDAFTDVYDNCVHLYYWGGSYTRPLCSSGNNDVLCAHISLYREDRNMMENNCGNIFYVRDGVSVERAKEILLYCSNNTYKIAIENWESEDVSENIKQLKLEILSYVAKLPKAVDAWLNARELWIEEMSSDFPHNRYRQNSGKMLVDFATILSNIPD